MHSRDIETVAGKRARVLARAAFPAVASSARAPPLVGLKAALPTATKVSGLRESITKRPGNFNERRYTFPGGTYAATNVRRGGGGGRAPHTDGIVHAPWPSLFSLSSREEGRKDPMRERGRGKEREREREREGGRKRRRGDDEVHPSPRTFGCLGLVPASSPALSNTAGVSPSSSYRI